MTESIYSPRLPSTVIPRHYDLTLKPDLVGCTFDGDVIIGVQVNSPVTSVFLNSKELAYPEAIRFVHSSTESEVVSSEVKIIDADQVAEIVFPTQLSVGEGKLFIKYTGILNPNMVGFYASTYEKDGVRKTMATTQFEAVYARQALPCWDEPAIKATFTVHLIVSKELTAVSNMPLVKSEEMAEGTLVKRSFDKSPIMSTYLLAFIVGEFDFIETKTKAGVDVRVYTPVGKTDQGKFSLELAAKVLDFYNKYFEIEYPLPKLDQLAIPDFAMGAMENWGCVTYRSTALLVDSKLTSAAAKQWVALVVSHELAHQWFGNLVTMEWWTHLWLNGKSSNDMFVLKCLVESNDLNFK